MRISLEELKQIFGFRSISFEERILDLSPYVDKTERISRVFKRNSSQTVRDSFNSGRMKDFCYYEIAVKKGLGKSLGYKSEKIAEYVESRDYEENQSGQMIITTVYKIDTKKNSKKLIKNFYVACRNVINFPVLVIEDSDNQKQNIPLFPYIWEVYLYAFEKEQDLLKYYPDITDFTFYKECFDRDKKIFDDSKFLLNELGIDTCAVCINDVCTSYLQYTP